MLIYYYVCLCEHGKKYWQIRNEVEYLLWRDIMYVNLIYDCVCISVLHCEIMYVNLLLFGTVYLIQLISLLWLLSKGPLLILISLILRFFLSNFYWLVLLLILVTCHITLLLSLRAVVSAISAFLTLGTHCSHISHFNTCLLYCLCFLINWWWWCLFIFILCGEK